MDFYAPFTWPFLIGAVAMFGTILTKWGLWWWRIPREKKGQLLREVFTRKSILAIGEVVSEALLHRRIWRIHPMLGYMHMSLALGWFLLIAVGWVETMAYLGPVFVPLQGHVFFKYFAVGLTHIPLFEQVMDGLLLFVLSGVLLAWMKRLRSRLMGMRRTTRHVLGDRVALSALWAIFPLRLVAESLTCALYGSHGFLTGSLGGALASLLTPEALAAWHEVAWWCYSTALGCFFAAMPFSRYMHIFTEVPLIFLRRYGLHAEERRRSSDNFQVEACSRCGICIDPCQMQQVLQVNNVQSVYFLRDRRYHTLSRRTTDNCLMCGRCEERCPVGLELTMLRLNTRASMRVRSDEPRYEYLQGLDRSTGDGAVGYFAGCMTLRTPRILEAMRTLFREAGEEVWWADKEGGVCCGRPLKLAGEVDAARRMMDYNVELIRRHNIRTLVTSCPICLRVFREDYALEGVEVLHHSEYILRLVQSGRLTPHMGGGLYTYHDPCELGRGCGIYDEPRELIRCVGRLVEPHESREKALCCGSSVANLRITDDEQVRLAEATAAALEETRAETIVTACPLCKTAIRRGTRLPVMDLAEVVAASLKK